VSLDRVTFRKPWVISLAVAVPLVALYLIIAPPAADLAAATYRSDLFARVGFTTWDSGWYAAHGHNLPSYSLLSPALGALLGVRVLLGCSAIAASVLFALIADRAFGTLAARVAAAWFALGVCVGLLSGRVPFELGLAIGLGTMLALMRGPLVATFGLAGVTSVASPVAGAFLALVALAGALVGDSRRYLIVAVGALIPILLLTFAYPEGGYEPFAPSAFWPALGPLSPRGRRIVRTGAALYALALIAAFAIHTPMGGNSARLGPLLAGSLVAGVLWEDRRAILLLLAPALLYWQLVAPIRDYRSIAGDPSVHASYYAPLLAELTRLGAGRATTHTIVEVPLTKAHWEAAHLAGHDGVELARGWERQLDTRYATLFYAPHFGASGYRTWLRQNKVEYVALPDAPLDTAGRAEGKLIADGLPYLRELWRSEHWRLYRMMG
jgi:hypothetical protein